MLSALMFTVRSLRSALRFEGRLSGPLRPQTKVISLGRDELPDYLLRDLGIFDGNRSDWEACHPFPASCPSAGISSIRDALGGIGGGIVTTAVCRRRVLHDHD
jgi:hypothetical protein